MEGFDAAHFEQQYAAVGRDLSAVPWVRLRPNPILVGWLESLSTRGERALVVGCGVGDDAAYLADRGYAVTAFDISPTAIRHARERFPDNGIDFRVADWFALPDDWNRVFDVVVEIGNVQALPDRRAEAFSRIGATVAPGGRLLVRCYAATDAASGSDPSDGPPWPITRAELTGAEDAGLVLVTLDETTPGGGGSLWWTAEFTRRTAPRPMFGEAQRADDCRP